MNAIAECMNKIGLTQSELARKFGVTPAAVSHWATGRNKPRVAHIAEMARMADVPIESLLGLPADKYRNPRSARRNLHRHHQGRGR